MTSTIILGAAAAGSLLHGGPGASQHLGSTRRSARMATFLQPRAALHRAAALLPPPGHPTPIERAGHSDQRRQLQLKASQRTAPQPVPPFRTDVPALFHPIQLRGLVIPNRIFLSPMCMYSAAEGLPNQWHLVHLGARAAGGCGLVMAEASAVVPEGRISPSDTGIWNDDQVQAWRPITEFIRGQGALASIQLAHAGRKACTGEPTRGSGRPLFPGRDSGAWQAVGPSAVPFARGFQIPREMTLGDIGAVVEAFAEGAKRALRAGFQVIEIHMAHGYLLHQFLSPISNHRNDQYGGSLENRMRLPLEVADAVRSVIPDDLPLLIRISATDWAEPQDGPAWDLDQSVEFVRALQTRGSVDLVDVSSGGSLARAPAVRPLGPGYQVPFSEHIRQETGVPTGAVGLITLPAHAESILRTGKADAIFLARVMLREPHWPLRAASELGFRGVRCPPQYERAIR